MKGAGTKTTNCEDVTIYRIGYYSPYNMKELDPEKDTNEFVTKLQGSMLMMLRRPSVKQTYSHAKHRCGEGPTLGQDEIYRTNYLGGARVSMFKCFKNLASINLTKSSNNPASYCSRLWALKATSSACHLYAYLLKTLLDYYFPITKADHTLTTTGHVSRWVSCQSTLKEVLDLRTECCLALYNAMAMYTQAAWLSAKVYKISDETRDVLFDLWTEPDSFEIGTTGRSYEGLFERSPEQHAEMIYLQSQIHAKEGALSFLELAWNTSHVLVEWMLKERLVISGNMKADTEEASYPRNVELQDQHACYEFCDTNHLVECYKSCRFQYHAWKTLAVDSHCFEGKGEFPSSTWLYDAISLSNSTLGTDLNLKKKHTSPSDECEDTTRHGKDDADMDFAFKKASCLYLLANDMGIRGNLSNVPGSTYLCWVGRMQKLCESIRINRGLRVCFNDNTDSQRWNVKHASSLLSKRPTSTVVSSKITADWLNSLEAVIMSQNEIAHNMIQAIQVAVKGKPKTAQPPQFEDTSPEDKEHQEIEELLIRTPHPNGKDLGIQLCAALTTTLCDKEESCSRVEEILYRSIMTSAHEVYQSLVVRFLCSDFSEVNPSSGTVLDDSVMMQVEELCLYSMVARRRMQDYNSHCKDILPFLMTNYTSSVDILLCTVVKFVKIVSKVSISSIRAQNQNAVEEGGGGREDGDDDIEESNKDASNKTTVNTRHPKLVQFGYAAKKAILSTKHEERTKSLGYISNELSRKFGKDIPNDSVDYSTVDKATLFDMYMSKIREGLKDYSDLYAVDEIGPILICKDVPVLVLMLRQIVSWLNIPA